MAAYEILLMDDGSSLFRTLIWALESKGYRVAAVSSPEAAIESLVFKNYDLLVVKLKLDHHRGMEVVKRARKLNPEIRIIVVGGDRQVAFPLEAYRLKLDDYILMPCSPAELWRRVARCLGSLEARPAASDSQVRLAAINERVLNKLAIMFHDIRSSMISTSAALKLLIRGAHGEMDAEATKKIQDLHSRIKKIVGVSEEYMAHFLSGNNDVTLDSKCVDLKAGIVEPVLEEFLEEIQDRGIIIDNRLQTMAAVPIKGSKLYLKSVFRNLLSNGIKYGGDGCTITIDLEDKGANCYLKVWNSGQPGLEENQPLLFPGCKPLMTGEGAGDQGLGLGLRLIKDLIKEHGGEIWYEPQNNGSNFVITLSHC
jgi:signal transduction histidine kinase